MCQDVTKCLLSVIVCMFLSECRGRQVCKAHVYCEYECLRKWGGCMLECVPVCLLLGHVISVGAGVNKEGFMVGTQSSF